MFILHPCLSVFRELKERGLAGVTYVVSDDHEGLTAAIGRNFQWVVWKRCQVHFIRDVLGKETKKDRGRIAGYLKEITSACTVKSARKRIREAVVGLEVSHPRIAEYIETYGEEILSVYVLPEYHRKSMGSTNMQEQLNEEIKRRTRVICIFPNEASCIRLVSALAMEANEEWMERNYLDMNAVEMTWCGMTDAVPHYLENAPHSPYFHSSTTSAS